MPKIIDGTGRIKKRIHYLHIPQDGAQTFRLCGIVRRPGWHFWNTDVKADVTCKNCKKLLGL